MTPSLLFVQTGRLLLPVFFLIGLTGCKSPATGNGGAANSHLQAQVRDSVENELVATVEEIYKNLDMIREKQGLISSIGSGEDLDKKNEILKTISLINSLLSDNDQKIAELSTKAASLGDKNSAMLRLVAQMKQRIEKQEKEIIYLKQQLAMEEFKVADLYNKMDEVQVANEVLESEKNELMTENKKLEEDLNKAFFVYGTREQLEKKGIIEKKGRILGLGGRNVLANAFSRNREYFSELDLSAINTIPIQGVKPHLLTLHPTGSYEWEQGSEKYSKLLISDPKTFWSVSRFLVIQVEN